MPGWSGVSWRRSRPRRRAFRWCSVGAAPAGPRRCTALADRLGRDQCQYIDVERAASTPERFFRAVTAASPFPGARRRDVRGSAREAFDHTLSYFAGARRRSSRHLPAGRSPRAAHVRELPGLAPRAARAAAGAGRKRQPLRADLALRRAGASPAARRLGALRSDPSAGAVAERGHRHAAADGRSGVEDREFLSRTIQALSDGRAALRSRHQRSQRRRQRPRRRSDLGAHRPAHLGRRAHRVVRLSLRAAPAPRARLRRAQGDSRDPRRGGTADAHRDRAAPASHARLDEGLSVVARGRRSRRLAAEALQLRGSAAAPVGPPALPPGPARRRRSRARGAELRAGAAAAAGALARDGRRRRRERKGGASSRSIDGEIASSVEVSKLRSVATLRLPDCDASEALLTRARTLTHHSRVSPPPAMRPSSAVFAASCSASFLVRPTPWAMTSPATSTSTWNNLRCSGPASPATR